jgi:hypothetical protein
MKKNKSKYAGTSNDPPVGLEIAPEALVNLANRLKLDLASQGQSKSKNAPVSNGKGKGKKEKNEKQHKNQEPKTSTSANGNNAGVPKKPAAVKEKEQKQPVEKKLKNSIVSEKKSDAALTSNGDGRPPKDTKSKNTKADSKPNRRPPKESASSKAETNTKSPPAKKDKKRPKANASEAQEVITNPLLDEILALGGTKEDLDLIEDVDSEEDTTEEFNPPKKSKGGEKTVQPSLILLMVLAPARITGPTAVIGFNWKVPRCLIGR